MYTDTVIYMFISYLYLYLHLSIFIYTSIRSKVCFHSNVVSSLNQGFESRWMSVEFICYVKTIIVFYISFTTSFVGGIL